VFVKICGITDRAALDAAVEAGADAVGFVFAASVRKITPDAARELCRDLPPDVIRVAVMHHPEAAEVRSVIERFGPDWVQSDAADFETLRIPAGTRRLPVYREGETGGPTALPDRIHFEGRISGSGKTADWNEASRLARNRELILAGGLDVANVERAIAAVRPFGVDVSSGVESGRGRKDPRKIREFVARVRALES
jgi:phosphoribosylanthranilate isomerase